jgi:hypothetical protein
VVDGITTGHTHKGTAGAQSAFLSSRVFLSHAPSHSTPTATARLCFYFFATLISHQPERLDEGLLPSREGNCWEAERARTRGKLDGSVVLDQE